MKKIFLLILITLSVYANNSTFIKNLIGQQKYKNYYELLKPILNEKSIIKTLEYLQNNGLIDLFFDKPKNIHPTFIFKDNNPIFDTKTLYTTLQYMGYYYYYPIEISKANNYKITIEMKSSHYIDPLLFSNLITKRGCEILNIKKTKDYTYIIDCKNQFLNATQTVDKKIKLLNAKGIYWINPNGFKKILISTSKLDNWYPHIVFFDTNLNILNIISKHNPQRFIYLKIPAECRYIKITDTFSKVNFKRGIYIKGIQ